MIVILLTTILIMSLFCNGMSILFEENMLLHPLTKWLKKKVTGNGCYRTQRGEWLFKPLFDCVYCMASIWGSIVYWVLMIFVYHQPLDIQIFIIWIVSCVCCVYVNGLLNAILNRLEGR